MKKNYSITVFLLFITSYSSLYCQLKSPVRPFEKIRFEGLQPIWHTTFYDTIFTDQGGDGYNRKILIGSEVQPLLHENFLYIAIHENGAEEIFGSYIHKINLSTGEIIWSDYFGLPKDTNQEIARLMYINDGGDLEIISQLKSDPYGFAYSLLNNKNMLFTRRIYNKETGSLLEWNRPNNNDTLQLRSVYTMSQYSGEVIKKGDELLYIQRILQQGKTTQDYSFTKSENKIFKKNENRSIVSNENNVIYLKKIVEDGDNGYIIPEINIERNKLILKHIDDSFQQKNVFESIETPTELMYLHKVNESEEKILFFNFPRDAEPTDGFVPMELRIYNFEANLLHTYEIPKKYSANFCILDWRSDNEIVIAGSNFFTDGNKVVENSLDILKSNSSGEFELVKSFQSTDSLRFLNLNNLFNELIYKIDDSKLLLSALEQSFRISPFGSVVKDQDAFAQSLFLIDLENLGLVSTINENIAEISVKLIPNISQDHIELVSDKDIHGTIKIMDNLGRKVSNIEALGRNRMTIPINNFSNGMYHIQILYSNTKSILTLKFVKI